MSLLMNTFWKNAALGPLLHVLLLAALALPVTSTFAGKEEEAEEGARALATSLEAEGYIFRADSYSSDLEEEIGKAVRLQLFKGNEYKFCVAVSPKSGVVIDGTVLDLQGKPSGEIQSLEDGWGFILTFSPSKTGVYAVAFRQTEAGKRRKTPVAMVTGYK